MRRLAIDIETYSSVDIKESGVYAYVDAPDFDILLIAYKLDDQEVMVLDLLGTKEEIEMLGMQDYGFDVNDIAEEFLTALKDPTILKTAFNANFERTCLSKYFGIECPPEQWKCTMITAVTLGLPRSLGEVGAALGLPQDVVKDKQGKALIEYFCKPCKPTKTNGGRTRNYPRHAPDKWELFKKYNGQDVVAEQAIYDRLSKYPYPASEKDLWNLDQRINDRGIGVDIDMAKKIISYDAERSAQLVEEAKDITGLANPNSLAQLKQWLATRYGIDVKSITKDTIPIIKDELKALGDVAGPGIRLLEIRQSLGKTSVKKYQAMINAVSADGRIKGILQFYGANRTGRWAGRIVQVHNLPQNKIDAIDLARELAANGQFEDMEMLFGETAFVFSQLIRTAFVASKDCRFVVSDFSAIEARVISWLAGEEWRLEVFRTHGKIYEASASQMFHVPIEDIKKGSKLRQQGKIAELALGYQGSFGAIKSMDKDGSIPDDDIPLLVRHWRDANPKIVKFWYTVETAAKTCIKERRSVRMQYGLTFSYIDNILFIKLPSGRCISYWGARLDESDKGEKITYSGVNQDTKKWGRLETYGGKLVENIVQATARDCLGVAMMKVAAVGYQIVMHVHDEMIVDVPNCYEDAAEKITAIMATPIEWAPGLPLKGDTYETPFYKKD